MNKNILIVLGGGFLIAVLVALLVQASLGGGGKKKQQVVKQDARTMIVVAARPLKAGEVLDDKNMKWKDWPRDGLFPAAVERAKPDQAPSKAISGRVLREMP